MNVEMRISPGRKDLAIFAVSRQQFEIIRKYMIEQKNQRKNIGFQYEMPFVDINYKIDFDEHYLWTET